MEKLAIGEKYLSIVVVGHNPIPAFKNKDKKKSTEPDYKGNGVAVWINTKKAKEDKINVVESDLL